MSTATPHLDGAPGSEPAPRSSAASPPPLPTALSEMFDVIRPLGMGGMGAVWLVRDRFLDRAVALKVLLAEHDSAPQRERFLREARTSARLEHPHIIDVYRADETAGTVWFTMRFVDGESLGDRLRERGPLSPTEAVRILREVAWGLAYAHARGVVHRDIKPDNILLDRGFNRAVVTDFGIARDHSLAAHGLTIDNHVLGSVHFMSPEQAAGEPLDGRSDLYALGVVGFLALAGQLPFDGPPQTVLVAHVTKPAPSLRTIAPSVPRSVADVIDRCLRKHPDERYPNADALATALDVALRDAEAAAQSAADAAPGAVISEQDALAIWQRAAQLQAEAAHRMERTAKLNAPSVAGSEVDGSSGNSDAYRIRDVEAAAVEAGISRQYVALALAERRAPRTGRAAPAVVSDRQDRQFTTMLGTTDRAISVSRVIPASPKATLAAIGEVFPKPPYFLRFHDTVNGHPLDGGILRFTAPRLGEVVRLNAAAITQSDRLVYRLEQIELFDLHVTLHARGSGQTPSCEVVVTGDLRSGLRRNLNADWAFTGAGGALGAAAGTTLFHAVLGSVGMAALPGLGLGAMAAGATMLWYRWLYRQALNHALEELGKMLEAIESHLTREHVFSFNDLLPPSRQ